MPGAPTHDDSARIHRWFLQVNWSNCALVCWLILGVNSRPPLAEDTARPFPAHTSQQRQANPSPSSQDREPRLPQPNPNREPRPPIRILDTAQLAPDATDISAAAIVNQLASSEVQVRRNALRNIPHDLRTPAVRQVVTQLATGDQDAVVRSRSQLILADWPQSNDAEKALSAKVAQFEWASPSDRNTAHFPTETVATAQFTQPVNELDSLSSTGPPVPPIETQTRLPVFAPPPPEPATGAPTSAGVVKLPDIEPEVLNRPLDGPLEAKLWPEQDSWSGGLLEYEHDAPLGYTGPSGVLPIESQETAHFVPIPDRWRAGFPTWDRYTDPDSPRDHYPYYEGNILDPYNQNVLKGDYPIIGQHTFFKLTAEALLINEYRQLPTPTTPFESTVDPFQEQFFGDPNQYFTTNNLILSFELFHGNAGFKPFDWMIRLTPIFNMNYLDTNELAVVNPDVRQGTTRWDEFLALEEYFVEAKLFDLSPEYDFASIRIGSQPFVSDFRGFIFADVNRGIRLFGTRFANRDQFNLVYFNQVEKDTNSQLNTFEDRKQHTLIANYFRQDFMFPGYTGLISAHYNQDGPDFKFDENNFLARPDPAGNFEPHRVETVYLGFAGEGHIGKLNVSNSFYWALGEDTFNPIAGRRQDINAQMAALELSFDRDWIRFRSSVFWSSGDDNPKDNEAEGFDSIFDNPNFAGGEFSFWQRQEIRLFGVGLVNRLSLVPDLRSSKFQGQPNFVNPGLLLLNLGMDFEVTPKLRFITNANYLEFDSVEVLEHFTFQDDIDNTIGVDLSVGVEYRPLLNDNIVFEGGYAALIPGRGFKDLYGATEPFTTANADHVDVDTLHSLFLQMIYLY